MQAVQIVGAGGIGCAVGYALRSAGVPVVFIESNAKKVAAGRREGVRVDSLPSLEAEFISFREWEPQADHTVLLCVKCYDNATVLARLLGGVELIPIQNGFDPKLASHGHRWEGIASFVSECDADRPHTRITRSGELHLGSRERTDSPLPDALRMLVSLNSPLFRTLEVPAIEPIKYAKLMYNAAISPLAAAAGIDNGQLLSLPSARTLFFALLQENHRILSAAKITLGKVGPFHPRTVAWIVRRRWLAGLMAKFFEPSLRGTYCSMAGEIEKGRTEIDHYNGYLLHLAEQTGTPCPLNQAVHALVTRMTTERSIPRVEMLEEVLAESRPTHLLSTGSIHSA